MNKIHNGYIKSYKHPNKSKSYEPTPYCVLIEDVFEYFCDLYLAPRSFLAFSIEYEA